MLCFSASHLANGIDRLGVFGIALYRLRADAEALSELVARGTVRRNNCLILRQLFFRVAISLRRADMLLLQILPPADVIVPLVFPHERAAAELIVENPSLCGVRVRKAHLDVAEWDFKLVAKTVAGVSVDDAVALFPNDDSLVGSPAFDAKIRFQNLELFRPKTRKGVPEAIFDL